MLYGGRFNPNGLSALHFSLSVMTELRRANQAGGLQPTTLVSYNASIDGIFDSRDKAALSEWKMICAEFEDSSWRDQMKFQRAGKTKPASL